MVSWVVGPLGVFFSSFPSDRLLASPRPHPRTPLPWRGKWHPWVFRHLYRNKTPLRFPHVWTGEWKSAPEKSASALEGTVAIVWMSRCPPRPLVGEAIVRGEGDGEEPPSRPFLLPEWNALGWGRWPVVEKPWVPTRKGLGWEKKRNASEKGERKTRHAWWSVWYSSPTSEACEKTRSVTHS